MSQIKKDWKAQAWEWAESIVVAFLLAMFIRAFFVQPFKIPSGSMRMTLIEGDRLFVNKLNYGPLFPFTTYRLPGYGKIQRGDVIVFRYPVTKDKDFIKRLIAFGGEKVKISNGRVFINGEPQLEGPLGNFVYANMGDFSSPDFEVTVPQGQLFVLGDNSASSHDSRYWGFVPEGYVIGKAEFLFWPANRVGLIK